MRRRRRRRSPKQWISDFLQRRQEQGAYSNMIQEIRENDLDRFINFHRMTPQTFDYLLRRVEPLIKHTDIRRESLSPGLRLSLTLRYLASGDSMVSLHYLFRVSKSSVTRTVAETCEAIWDVLAAEVIRLPTTAEWEAIAEGFGSRWNFPNCLGAIDGKHVVVQCFNKTGSQFYNYKGSFSINLMAVCDSIASLMLALGQLAESVTEEYLNLLDLVEVSWKAHCQFLDLNVSQEVMKLRLMFL